MGQGDESGAGSPKSVKLVCSMVSSDRFGFVAYAAFNSAAIRSHTALASPKTSAQLCW